MDSSSDHHFIRSRVSNACDSCKARKVKCDGKSPCSYCTRRHRADSCHYSPQLKRRHARRSSTSQQQLPRSPPASVQEPGHDRGLRHQSSSSSRRGSRPQSQTPKASAALRSWEDGPGSSQQQQEQRQQQQSSTTHDTDGDDEAEVPREARLLCDAQGKLIFIGDCAPLSFFQSVRQLITSRVDENALSPNSSRYSVLENAPSKRSFFSGSKSGPPDPLIDMIPTAVSRYFAATAGLVDLFENTDLTQAITTWAKHSSSANNNTSAVHYLVLAIGHQDTDDSPSQDYFEHARNMAFQNLSENLGIGTVQAYVLITLFMLRACQINGAFIFFGIAVRSAYSIGIHRTEVNQRFGPQMQRQRDRLWMSLRVVDLFLSTNMGRPPATSDIDCTVPYRTFDGTGQETFDTLSAAAQIFLIMEALVVEVYSRRKISLQLTEGISSQLRDWSGRWLPQIKDLMTSDAAGVGQQRQAQVCAATQVLTSYYYAVILVSRPFLMFEVHRRLGSGPRALQQQQQQQSLSGKSKLADACIDAACLMVELVSDVIDRGLMPVKMPLVVSWLFAASLTLGLGLIGGFGRSVLERHSRTSIAALEFFARTDAHAMQYSLIARSLLDAGLGFLEKREMAERLQRTQSSAQLFGLMPSERATAAGQSPGGPSGGGGGGAGTVSPGGMGFFGQQHRISADSAGAGNGGGLMHGGGQQQQHNDNENNGTAGAIRLAMSSPFGDGNGNSNGNGAVNDTSSLLGGIDAEAGFLSLSGLGVSSTTPDTLSFDPLGEGDQSFNLFPLLEASGDIDLAHYF
ncbi:hypothetical protein Micbo1qcDRAFT_154985 [Microdochium bolleyi]|uniref:Zn(2)-C6 fungal-type domain-containing protein n=1 Tax=Microdochium bolleyi TaxID=196109 RepID=A0A136JGY3_9PEZI|nr:hypothetical protein Micbo1qcDRAFT_154985 [Microdochium bolleyi]